MRFRTIARYDAEIKMYDSINNIISSTIEEEYNEDFINEMKRIDSEESIPLSKEMKNMVMPREEQLQGELAVLKDCHQQVCQQLVEEQEKNKRLNTEIEGLNSAIDKLGQSINRLLVKENQNLSTKVQHTSKFLNTLYEAIDEHYTEVSENNDYIDAIRAKAQLKLITQIIDEVDRK